MIKTIRLEILQTNMAKALYFLLFLVCHCHSQVVYIDANLDNTLIGTEKPVIGKNLTAGWEQGNTTNVLWHYRNKKQECVQGGTVWECFASENILPLAVSFEVPHPGTYRIYGFYELTKNNGSGCAFKLLGDKNYSIATTENTTYFSEYSTAKLLGNDAFGKNIGLFLIGYKTTSEPNEEITVYAKSINSKNSGKDIITSFDGIGYEFIEPVSDMLNGNRPYLILSDERLRKLKDLSKIDTTLNDCVDSVIKRADRLLETDLLERVIVGPRLLAVSRSCVRRIYTLAMAWRWTGQDKYADCAVNNLIAVADFKDWNPSHFLDTAEMTHAVAIGYDWLYDYFTDQQRRKIRNALIDKGIQPALDLYFGTLKTNHPWPVWNNNWNQVCNFGTIIGCLAVIDSHPDILNSFLPLALRSLPTAMATYAQDGAWPEGIGYWNYATTYTVFGLCALETALGSDFGISNSKGFSQTSYFPVYMSSPTGKTFNYADDGTDKRFLTAVSFWLAEKFDQPYVINDQHTLFDEHRLNSFASEAWSVAFYQSKPQTTETLPLDILFDGVVQVASFRCRWDDPDALYLAVKAGDNQFPHAHLDLGSFVLDAMGVRWVCDLGSGDYNLPGYWEMESDGRRWEYYRCASFSHNIPTFDGKNQDVYAKSNFINFKSEKNNAFASLDLTQAYKEFSSNSIREYLVTDNRRKVVITDKFDMQTDAVMRWGITTKADIRIVSDTEVVLSRQGKEMYVKLNSSTKNEGFRVYTPDLSNPQRPLKGVSRLEIEIHMTKGTHAISVEFTPRSSWE